jgi:O-Antigen ligase
MGNSYKHRFPSGPPSVNLEPSEAAENLKMVSMLFTALILVTALSVVSPIMGLGLLILLVIGMLIRHSLKVAIFVLAFIIPFDPQFQVSTGTFVSLDLVFAAVAVPVMWQLMKRHIKIEPMAFFLVPYIIFAVTTTAWRADNGFWFWGSCVRLLIVVFVTAAVSTIESADLCIVTLGCTLPPLMVYGLYQLWINDFGELYMLFNPHHQDQPWFGRAYSLLLHPNAYGGFCVVVSVMLVAFALRTKNAGPRVVALACATCGFVGAMSSGSRGSWIAAIVSFLAILSLGRTRLLSKILLVSALSLVILLATALPYLPLQRGESLDDYTVETRTMVYATALFLFLEHPWIGIGMTNFQDVLPDVIEWDNPIIHAHNIYLQVLAEDGIFGFLLYYVPIFYLLYWSLRRATSSTTGLMASAGLIAICVHGLVDNLLYSNPQYLLTVAFVFGLAVKAFHEHRVEETTARAISGRVATS